MFWASQFDCGEEFNESSQESTPSSGNKHGCSKNPDQAEKAVLKFIFTWLIGFDKCLAKEFIPHEKEVQKCGKLELVGARGKEHEKENCHKNFNHADKYMECHFKFSHQWVKNENFMKCLKKVTGELKKMIEEDPALKAKYHNQTSQDRDPMPMLLKLKDDLHGMES
ncbi:uncharacterized protein LOC141854896 [Brevipalpus obovatus]|uniref:uncharacterized protein LOC141854896 n=1 Tax=Brevipalpus obovatus TaxID=246614 RepID=UPI003D9DEC06